MENPLSLLVLFIIVSTVYFAVKYYRISKKHIRLSKELSLKVLAKDNQLNRLRADSNSKKTLYLREEAKTFRVMESIENYLEQRREVYRKL
jgi:hypothetical protein